MLNDVAIDRDSLAETDLGGSGRGYSVRLSGPVDSNWLESYRLLHRESAKFFRFYLDAETRSVMFACRAGDVLTDVTSILQILDSLIELTNKHASERAEKDRGEPEA